MYQFSNEISLSKDTCSSTEDDTEPKKLVEVEDRIETAGVSKKKKRKKRFSLPPEIRDNQKLHKYWHKRFSLFSRFDQGIKLDEGR